MGESSSKREQRAIRIQTVDGPIQGSLSAGPGQRVLDELNGRSRRFITIHSAKAADGTSLGAGELAVNKGAILFVREVGAPPPQPAAHFGNFRRVAIRLTLREFQIEGFVIVPDGGAPLKRLDHDGHDFFSTTSVLLQGPDGHETVPFLAVNRRFVTTALVDEAANASSRSGYAGAEVGG